LLEEIGKVHKTDVLIVGGGIAGLFAAIRAKEFVEHVTVVDKGPIGKTSQAYFALGGHQVLLPGDDLEAWLSDVVYFTDGLCDQELVESIYLETYNRIRDLERFGVEFIKEPNGRYKRFPTRGLPHVRGIRPEPHGLGGKVEIEALFKEAQRRGVNMLSRIMVTDLLKDGERVCGAVGFGVRGGEFYIFETKAIVIATGSCSFKGHYAAQAFSTGEGFEMAFRAGAELKNLEFATLWMQPAHYTWEALGTSFPLGAIILNAKGERFMERYCPSLKEMIDFNYIARACAFEARKGNAPFYIDHTTIKREDLRFLKDRAGWMEIHVKKLEELGVKPYEEKQECMPAFWSVSGIKADLRCGTSVQGLFVCGKAMSIDPGVTMGSWSIASATVTGYRAGESAGRYAQTCKYTNPDPQEALRLRQELFKPTTISAGADPKEAIKAVQETIFPYEIIVIKHEERLKQALEQIKAIRNELMPSLHAKNPHELVQLREARSMALIAELMLKASLLRTESRASHFREDYPNRDDKNWLKWIVVKQKGEDTEFSTEPLPMERYRIKPERYYMDNFVMPT